MQIYKAPIADFRFILETFGYARVQALPGHEDYDLDTAMMLAEESGKFCTKEMLSLNRSADEEGLHYDPVNKTVTTPKGFIELYQKYLQSGMAGLTMPVEYGGGGAPRSVGILMSELATATNKSFSMCPGLNHGLVESVIHFGTDQLKKDWLPKLISGEWTGTMCLTEPHAGTDLGLLRTKAVPEGDHHLITGTKIWISFGEHDMTENIVHLVLARLPDAPPGIRGISVFLVPKFTLDGRRNSIYCGGLEHKMGIHASPTCVMNLEAAEGYLVGEPHKGIKAMFVMMNYARIAVGVEGIALSEIAYQTAVAFCRDRRQGRSLNPERNDQTAAADNILVHPDVRRQLLNVRSTTEGMRALALWCAIEIDIADGAEDEKEREQAADLVAILTPIVKAFSTDRGFLNVSECMQVCGGAGYTSDWSIEQYLRDVRIAMIYEGTNHIQALDLVGRKLPTGGGRMYRRFSKRIHTQVASMREHEAFAAFGAPLEVAINRLDAVTMDLATRGMADQEEAAAVATNYLMLFGYTALAYVWCKLAGHAWGKTGRQNRVKLKTARFYFANVLPEAEGLVAIMKAGKEHMMAFEGDEF